MAASAASPAHPGRLVLAAVLASGLIVLGLVFAKRFLNAKKKSSKSTDETVAKEEEKEEVIEEVTQEEAKVVESIKEESEPEPAPVSVSEPEPEPIAAAKLQPGETISSVLKVELKPSPVSPRRGISVSPARFLPSPTPESAAVEEAIESAEATSTESATPASSASEPETAVTELPSEETEEEAAETDEAGASSGQAEEEPTQANESLSDDDQTAPQSSKDVHVKSWEFKLDPEAQPFMPRDSSLMKQFTPSEGSIVSEIVASGMGGEGLAEPIEKEADLEELSDDGAAASNEVDGEDLSIEMVELKEAAAAIVSGPNSSDLEQPLSTGSNYVVIDPDQANNNSLSPQSSESDHQLPPGQYDDADADENHKSTDQDMNSDSPFDFFDLATSPNDFKPSFDFVDPNENLPAQRGSDEDIEMIGDPKDQDEDEYIPDMAFENVEEDQGPPDFSSDDIASALDAANNDPHSIGTKQLEVLVSLILSKDYDIQQATMAGVVKCAAFTVNQNSLRELGCPKKLAILLKSYVMSMKVGYNVSTALITSVSNAISNMSVNEKNQIVLQETVPLLVDLTVEGEMKETALLSTLRALTNLSTTERHHGQYTRMVQYLYNLMDAGSTPIKLQALKVLVNLSCSGDMVQHLLAAKAPINLLELLEQDTEEALVLRWTTLLANIVHTVRINKMSQSSLPCPEKAASPETMYTAVYGVQSMGDLKSKIFLLSKHKNEDIRYQAARVYSGLVR